jgi:hypothetical protein
LPQIRYGAPDIAVAVGSGRRRTGHFFGQFIRSWLGLSVLFVKA